MEKLNYLENKKNWVGYFILNSLNTEKVNKEKLDPENLEVELKINGQEQNFTQAVEKLVRTFDYHVEQRAKELVEEKWNEVVHKPLDDVTEMANFLKQAMQDRLDEAFQK